MQEEQFVEQPEILPELGGDTVNDESSPEADVPSYDNIVDDSTLEAEQTHADALAEDTERYESATATLEAYIGLMQSAGSAGITRQSAAIMNVGLKQIYKTLDIGDVGTGLESYISGDDTTVSIESLKEKAKAAGKWIWEKIIKAVKALYAFGESLVGKVAQVHAKAKELAEAVKNNKTVAGVEFELPINLSTALYASIGDRDTLDHGNSTELQLIEIFVMDIPNAVTEDFIAVASGKEAGGESSALTAQFKRFHGGIILANGLEVLSFKNGEDWSIGTKSHPYTGEPLKLKTRSWFEMAKSLKTAMAVLDIYKDRAAKSVKRISEAIDKAYAGLEGIEEERAEANKEHIAHLSRYLSNPLHRQVTATILNNTRAKIAAVGLELEAGKTALNK